MIEVKKKVALNAFNNGFNCAQSVLKASNLNFDFNLEQALNLSSGFGGGMGKLQNTCGAVTGAFMTIGLFNSRSIEDKPELKARNEAMIQHFEKEFKATHNSIKCATLLNCDLNTKEGQEYFKAKDLGKNVCEKCIVTSIEILDRMLQEQRAE